MYKYLESFNQFDAYLSQLALKFTILIWSLMVLWLAEVPLPSGIPHFWGYHGYPFFDYSFLYLLTKKLTRKRRLPELAPWTIQILKFVLCKLFKPKRIQSIKRPFEEKLIFLQNTIYIH